MNRLQNSSLWFRLFSGWLIAGGAFAATVTKLLPDKSAALVTLEGDEAGLEKGAKICFEDPDNSSRKLCGQVAKTTGKKAILRFSKKSFPKISKGMQGGAGGSTSASTKSSGGKKAYSAVRLLYAPHVMSHVSFALPTYQPPSFTSGNTGSLWQSGTVTKSSFAVFGAEGQFPIGSMGLGLGLRYKIYSDQTILTDLIKNQEQPYLESVVGGSALGFWFDLIYMTAHLSEEFMVPLTAGLDFEMSSIHFTATSKNDTTGQTSESTNAESSLTAVALRLGTGFDLVLFKPVTLGAKINLFVPLTTLNKKESATVNDANAQSATKEQDVLEALAHKAGGVGLEVGLSMGAIF